MCIWMYLRQYEYQVENESVLAWKWSEVAQSCPTLCDPMDCSLPGSSVHGIFQAIVLEWIAISFSRGSSQPRDRTQVSHIAGRCFTIWAIREAPNRYKGPPKSQNYLEPEEQNWKKQFLASNYYKAVVIIKTIHVDIWQRPTQYCRTTIFQ